MDNSQKIFYTLLLTSVWTSYYKFLKYHLKFKYLSPFCENDVQNRTVAITHGLIAFWFNLITLIMTPHIFKEHNNTTVNILTMISLSYFIYDTVSSIYNRIMDLLILLHHMACLVVIFYCLYTSVGTYLIVLVIVLGQASNFPYHVMYQLTSLNLRYTKLYHFIENGYFFLYFFSRGVYGFFFTLYPVIVSDIHIFIKMVIFVMEIYSMWFLKQIYNTFMENQKRAQQMEQKGVEYYWFSEDRQQLKKLSFFIQEKKQN